MDTDTAHQCAAMLAFGLPMQEVADAFGCRPADVREALDALVTDAQKRANNRQINPLLKLG